MTKECTTCRIYREKNPDKVKNFDLKKFGIILGEYKLLRDVQNQRCKICGIHRSNLKRNLAVDHCHSTGKIRGLLCSNCNTALGKFKDSIEILESAKQYLINSESAENVTDVLDINQVRKRG